MEHRVTLWTLHVLAGIYQDEGRLKDAEKLNGEAIQAQRRVLGAEHPDTLASELDQADIYSGEGKYAEAEALDRELLTVQRRRLGEDHPEHSASKEQPRKRPTSEEGKYAQAEPIQRDLVDAMVRVHGEEGFETLVSMGNLAMLYGFEDKFAESEATLRQGGGRFAACKGKRVSRDAQIHGRPRVGLRPAGQVCTGRCALFQGFGNPEPGVGEGASRLADHCHGYGGVIPAPRHVPAGRGVPRHGAEGETPHAWRWPSRTLASIGDLGWLYVIEGRYAEAELLLREAADNLKRLQATTGSDTASNARVGMSLAGQKQYGQAEPLLVDGYQKMMERKATMPADGRSELAQAEKEL